MTNIDDIQKIKSVISLNISYNKVYDLNFIDSLCNLEMLYASNNEITSISNLMCSKKLKILEIQHNKLSYNMSTMKTLENIKTLRELFIEDNPVFI